MKAAFDRSKHSSTSVRLHAVGLPARRRRLALLAQLRERGEAEVQRAALDEMKLRLEVERRKGGAAVSRSRSRPLRETSPQPPRTRPRRSRRAMRAHGSSRSSWPPFARRSCPRSVGKSLNRVANAFNLNIHRVLRRAGLSGSAEFKDADVRSRIIEKDGQQTGGDVIRRVLVVDDSRLQRRILTASLQRWGFACARPSRGCGPRDLSPTTPPIW